MCFSEEYWVYKHGKFTFILIDWILFLHNHLYSIFLLSFKLCNGDIVLLLKYNLCNVKEVIFCHKLKLSNPYIFAICWRKPLIFQTLAILSIIIYSLKYQRSTTLGCKDIGILKIDFVTETHFLCNFLYKLERIYKTNIFQFSSRKLGGTILDSRTQYYRDMDFEKLYGIHFFLILRTKNSIIFDKKETIQKN